MMSSDVSSGRLLLLFFAAFGCPDLLEQIGLEEGKVNTKVDNTSLQFHKAFLRRGNF